MARIAPGIASIDANAWDALAGCDDPFLCHAFLSALETSGSVGGQSGWQSVPIVLEDGTGLRAAAPAYIKYHSQGEYVFDQGWAQAWERAGGRYYPKLQLAIPFTPVPGRRLLAGNAVDAADLIAAAEALVEQHCLSSAHATFVDASQIAHFEAAGWLLRRDSQFHWFNHGYRDFDDFLASLSSAKRKNIRKERAAAQRVVAISHYSGDTIRPEHWDMVWAAYQDTGSRKWGRPYLTRAAFDQMGATMADRILLILACQDGAPIAAALNFIGGDALYGRYWGAVRDIPMLHFELCYYQAMDFAIAHRLARVEAGAQGPHKLARGYVPVATWSAHHIPHPGFRRAVADFLDQERPAAAAEAEWLTSHAPYRQASDQA
ncbi:MAG: N-acetyltransferase [Sphingomonadaceae bacterium]|nr:N-acetyltransferase [Sphingomonadaceae bacterium]